MISPFLSIPNCPFGQVIQELCLNNIKLSKAVTRATTQNWRAAFIPVHMWMPHRTSSKDGITVDQLPLDVLIGPAFVADFPKADTVTPDSLEALDLPRETTRLIIKTRNSALWSDPHHVFNPNFVAINPEAANWVVNRGIRLIGIDYLSIQRYKDPEPLTHRILLEAGVVIVEGLCLQDVTGRTFTSSFAFQ